MEHIFDTKARWFNRLLHNTYTCMNHNPTKWSQMSGNKLMSLRQLRISLLQSVMGIRLNLNWCVLIDSLKPSDAYKGQQTNHHWSRQWLVGWPAPSHCLNQCSNITNLDLGSKRQRNLKGNSCIFIFKKMHLKISSGKFRPFCCGLNVLIGLPSQICVSVLFAPSPEVCENNAHWQT